MEKSEQFSDMERLGLSFDEACGHYGKMVFVTSPVTQSRVRVYIHGIGADWRFWLPLLAHTNREALSDTLLLDLPGFGGSDFNASDMSLDLIRDDIFNYIRAAGWTEVDLIGHSMGGFLAIHCAVHPPAELRRVVSVSGAYRSIMRTAQHPLVSLVRNPRVSLLFTSVRWFARLKPASCIARIIGNSDLLSGIAVRAFHSRPIPPSAARRITGLLPGSPLREIESIGVRYDLEVLWRDIHLPVLVVFGAGDKLVPPNDGRGMRELSDSISLITVPRVGHLSIWEAPRQIAQLIDQFLE